MREETYFRDEQFESDLILSRLQFIGFLVIVVMALLALRYHYLQIEQFDRFVTQSDENRIHIRAVAPTRGLIFDRNGVILAENRPSYTLTIVPESAPSVDELIDNLSKILEVSDTDLERFSEELNSYRRPFEPIPFRYKLTEEEVARFSVQQFDLQGADIQTELIRYYPLAEYFAHVVGYVGRINDQEQANIDAEAYAGTYVIGKTGVERQYEQELLGQVGYEYVETDARGNVLRVLERHHPVQGKNIYLTLDSELQVLVQDRLEGEQASAVALDVETSGVLAMVSTPSFDPNLFVSGISNRQYSALLENPAKPLFNRSLQGQYPPGSTVKPMFGLIALQEESITPDFTFFDPGFYVLEGQDRVSRDWKEHGHGMVDITKAVTESCNVFYYELAYRTGIDALADYGSRFGLGHKTGIDLPGEQSGVMPSPNWKVGSRGTSWFPGDTINVGIGQGFTLITPLQMAQMTSIIARRGEVATPSILYSFDSEQMSSPVTDNIEISDEYWGLIGGAMRDVVHSIQGTAQIIGRDLEGYEIAGKTGTAQAISVAADVDYDDLELERHQRDHALFVAYAPYDAPQVAVGIIVENGEHGGSMSAPIARLIFDHSVEVPLENAPLVDLPEAVALEPSVLEDRVPQVLDSQ